MAKILLVTEALTPTVVKLTTALRHHQHQVTLITSRDQDAELPESVEVLRPFKKWSVREALRLIPIIIGMSPQIVHLILEEDHLSPAQVVLSLLGKTLPHTVLTTSLLHIRHGLRRHNPVRYLLQESDIVTCPSVETLGALRGLNVKSIRQGRGLLPPVLDFNLEENSSERTAGAADLLRRVGDEKFFVVPFSEPFFDPRRAAFHRLTLLASRHQVVLLGSFAGWTLRDRKRFHAWMESRGLGHQWVLSGELGRADLRRLLAKAEALVLAGQALTPLEATEYFLHALQAGTTMILDTRQGMIHSDLWRNGENCWILSNDDLLKGLRTLISKDILKRPQLLAQDSRLQRELVDAPMNELNRLYNKALSTKHSV